MFVLSSTVTFKVEESTLRKLGLAVFSTEAESLHICV